MRQAAGASFSVAAPLRVNDERLILVVEDDDATRSFLLDNLEADGFRVAGASSPQEGVRAIEVRQPSLVVLDLAFANGSGLTGRAGEADCVRGFARGADDYLSKPTCHLLLLAVAPEPRARCGRWIE